MAKKRRGRPRKTGERYPSGDLKRDDRPPAVWRRIADEGVRAASDARLASQIGRLWYHGRLTNDQAGTASRFGEIYGRYEGFKGLRRTAKSPSYDVGYGEGAQDPADATALRDLELRIRRAMVRFDELQAELDTYPRDIRPLLEELCCNDRAIAWVSVNRIIPFLDQLTEFFSGRRRLGKITERLGRTRVDAKADVIVFPGRRSP